MLNYVNKLDLNLISSSKLSKYKIVYSSGLLYELIIWLLEAPL